MTDASWILVMEKEATRGGVFLKMAPTDQKTIEILSDPEVGESEFQGKKRTEFRFRVRDLKTGEELIWAVTQREVENQLIAILKARGLSSLVGQKLEIMTNGSDPKTKHWFIRPVGGFGIPSN